MFLNTHLGEAVAECRGELLLAKVAAWIHGGQQEEARRPDDHLRASTALFSQREAAAWLQHTAHTQYIFSALFGRG